MGKASFIKSDNFTTYIDYKNATEEFVSLVNSEDLDASISANPHIVYSFNEKIDLALDKAIFGKRWRRFCASFYSKMFVSYQQIKAFFGTTT